MDLNVTINKNDLNVYIHEGYAVYIKCGPQLLEPNLTANIFLSSQVRIKMKLIMEKGFK